MPIAAALLSTLLATGLMFAARGAFQIRTLPERITEWALLFVPADQFEAAISRFGTEAKVYALYGMTAGMVAVLLGVGAMVAWRAQRAWVYWLTGLLLFLFAMAVAMPATGAGFFASALPQDALLVNAVYAAIALAYVTPLLGLRALCTSAPDPARRQLLLSAGGTLASLALVWLFRERMVGSDLPLAQVEEQQPAQTPLPLGEAAPRAGEGVPVTPTTATAPSATPTPRDALTPALSQRERGTSPTAAPTKPVDEIPQPPPPRDLKRQNDGNSTAVPRKNGELASFLTPNDKFYITTKNPVADPFVDGTGWRLVLDGEVGKPVQLDYRTLRKLPSVEIQRTLECVSNFIDKPELAPFGNNLISNAVWRGVRLSDVLNLAGGIRNGAKWLMLVTADEFNAVIPAAAADDPECILAYEMNGEVLPREHGYPTRLLMPGRYGMKSAKWITGIRAQQKETLDWYGQRGWSKDGVVKTMSRIDVPGVGAELAPGPQRIAGIAYASNRGIAKVEFSADGGDSWQPAEIAETSPKGKYTWVIWQGTFEMPAKGTVTLRSRATDGAGELQIESFSLPQPDGASGWHTVEVKAV